MFSDRLLVDTQDYRGHISRACSFRGLLVTCSIILGLVILGARVVWLATDTVEVAHASLADTAQGNLATQGDLAKVLARDLSNVTRMPRRSIADRNGRLLASDITTYALGISPARMKSAGESPHDIASALSGYFDGLGYDKLLASLTNRKNYFLVKRRLDPIERDEVYALGLAAVELVPEPARIYFYDRELVHVLGFTNVDNRGKSGIEKGYESVIARTDQLEPVELTIDMRMQLILNEELEIAFDKVDALGVSGVIMDANTSEILAMSALPNFDPHHPSSAERSARFNRAAQRYEMGSTFKIFGTALALSEGYKEDRKVDFTAEDSMDEALAKVINTDYYSEAPLSLREVFVRSSNAGSARLALTLGAERQKEFLQSLGLLDPTGLMLPEIMSPVYPKYWGSSETATISYGYGLAVTPIHLLTAASAIVNGGTWRPARLLLHEDPRPAEAPRRVLSEEVAMKMRGLMREVVTHGTGRRADSPFYLVSGKTGTIEKLNPDGAYTADRQLATFIGVLSSPESSASSGQNSGQSSGQNSGDDPKLVIHLMFDEPQHGYDGVSKVSGGSVAAPVMARLADRLANVVNVVAAPNLAASGLTATPARALALIK